ncbi:MAG: 7TM diverse intracellular signaling domain-containing protein [Myxococcota bacterium]|nr:7TM diverse intracellular signaling domain-containing protein [Myxococcota bacterium]
MTLAHRLVHCGVSAFVVMLFAVLAGCQNENKTPPTAQEGVLDLRTWDLKTDGPVLTSGQWFFDWNSFAVPNPDRFDKVHKPTLIDIPSTWRSFPNPNFPNSQLPVTGYATYSLQVLLPESKLDGLTFSSPNQTSAVTWTIWSGDGKTQLGSDTAGTPSHMAKTAVPHLRATSISLYDIQEDSIYVVAHVSNYRHARGGLSQTSKIESLADARKNRFQQITLSGITLGICLIIGIYHLIIHLQQREEKAALMFAAICISVALREATTTNLFEHISESPSISLFNLRMELEYISIPCIVVSTGYFIHALAPDKFFLTLIRWLVLAPGVLLLLLPMMTTPLVFSEYVRLYQISIVAAALLGLTHLIRKISQTENLVGWALVAFGILVAGGIHDLLALQFGYRHAFIAPYTFIGFIALQSAILSARTARAFSRAGTLEVQTREQAEKLTLERSHRVEIEKNLNLELDTKVNLIANAIHHLNNPLNHIQGSLYLTQNEYNQLQSFINSLLPDDDQDDMVLAAQSQLDKHFATIDSSRQSMQDALSRATNSVMMLRALSQLDGICYNHSTIREVWTILVQRSSLPLNSIPHAPIKEYGAVSLIGHPALYAHAMELLFDVLWDTVQNPNQIQVKVLTAQQSDHDYHRIQVHFSEQEPTIVERCSELSEQITYLLKPYRCSLVLHETKAELTIRARQIPEAQMHKNTDQK